MTSAVTSGHFPLAHLYLAVLQCVSFAQRMPDCWWPSPVHMHSSPFGERQVLAVLLNFFINNHVSISSPLHLVCYVPHLRVTMSLQKWGCHPPRTKPFYTSQVQSKFDGFSPYPNIWQHRKGFSEIQVECSCSSIPRNLLRIFYA